MRNLAVLSKPYRALFFTLGILLAVAHETRAADASWQFLVNPTNSLAMDILHGQQLALKTSFGGWGPNWSGLPLNSTQKATGDDLEIALPLKIGDKQTKLGLQVSVQDHTAVFTYVLHADQDTPITQMVAAIGVTMGQHATAVLTGPDGQEKTVDLPVNIGNFGVISKITVTESGFESPLVITLDHPMKVTADRDLRVQLATDLIKAGDTRATITWTFPDPPALLAKDSDVLKFAPIVPTDDWFVYRPTWKTDKSVIGFEDWLEQPAGKHGGVRIAGDRFQFADGTPVQFWGVNLSYKDNAPEKANAEFTAARLAKCGVNAVRMHKFGNSGWGGIGDENNSTKMTPDGLDHFDYFTSQLAKNGIYYGWSHSFKFAIRPGDKNRLSGFDELMKNGGKTYAVINWAEDVQDLMIDMVVNLLRHKNPYTGTIYAEDPALSYVELQNEDDVFFYTTSGALNAFPVYRKQLEAHFTEWLTSKYNAQEKLAVAWAGALKDGESLEQSNLAIQGVPWEMSDAHLPQTTSGVRQRLLDTAVFLHYTQNKFYNKFVKAIRGTGYQGPLVGSPWQAPAMLPHYYNLRSDSLVGYIDRHNYFGGGFTDTLLKTPGGGFLSTGLQQVAGRPFGTSEWIHVYPSLYSAEGPVIMAAYGLRLQGWGASYEFNSTSKRGDSAKEIVGNQPFGVWNANVPTQIGQYPILARMIMRGDVTTAPVISTRRVSADDLNKGEFNFSDTVHQQGDVKTFSGSVPAESLAAGRDVVEFVDKTTPSTFPDMTKYTQGTVITSATGQLKWDSGDGVITIDTPGTQGYVGFAQGKNLAFGDVTIKPATPYAAILLTAANVKGKLADDERVLISAVARNANSGFRILTLDNRTIVDNGKSPIVLEPVKAEIRFAKRQIKQVNILDQDGNDCGRTLPATDGKFTINGTQDHTRAWIACHRSDGMGGHVQVC